MTRSNINEFHDLIIDGIDVAEGLYRTMGNRALYLQMLLRFRDDHADSIAEISHALNEQHDRALAERIAHTLKSVAALLGVTKVKQLAAQLEARIHDGDTAESLAALLNEASAEMHAVKTALAPVLLNKRRESAGSSVGSADKKTASERIQRIADLFRHSDGNAVDLLTESEQLLIAALGVAAHKKIACAARQFDFDAGLSALIAGAEAAGYKIL